MGSRQSQEVPSSSPGATKPNQAPPEQNRTESQDHIPPPPLPPPPLHSQSHISSPQCEPQACNIPVSSRVPPPIPIIATLPPFSITSPQLFTTPNDSSQELRYYQTFYDCCGRPIVLVHRYRRVYPTTGSSVNPLMTVCSAQPPQTAVCQYPPFSTMATVSQAYSSSSGSRPQERSVVVPPYVGHAAYPGNLRYTLPSFILHSQQSSLAPSAFYSSQSTPAVQICAPAPGVSSHQTASNIFRSVSEPVQKVSPSEQATNVSVTPSHVNQDSGDVSPKAACRSASEGQSDPATAQRHLEPRRSVVLSDNTRTSLTAEAQPKELLIFELDRALMSSRSTNEPREVQLPQDASQEQVQHQELEKNDAIATAPTNFVSHEPKHFNPLPFKTPKVKNYGPYEEL